MNCTLQLTDSNDTPVRTQGGHLVWGFDPEQSVLFYRQRNICGQEKEFMEAEVNAGVSSVHTAVCGS